MFDRLGAAHKLMVGYRGTRELIFEVGNIFLAQVHDHEAQPQSWPLPQATRDAVEQAAWPAQIPVAEPASALPVN
jgi:nitrogenase molybdenum-iron protein NifN